MCAYAYVSRVLCAHMYVEFCVRICMSSFVCAYVCRVLCAHMYVEFCVRICIVLCVHMYVEFCVCICGRVLCAHM